MKNLIRNIKLSVFPLAALILADPRAGAATNVWTGASGTDLNWATPGNWSPAGPPGAADAAQFFDTGATNDAVSINNMVSASTAVQSLWYGQTNGIHNTLIAPGMTLTLSGTGSGNILLAGTETDNGATQGETNTISGAGAALVVDNPSANIVVRQGVVSASSTSALRSTLDLSGLDNASLTVGRILVGSEGTYARPAGTLYLARTNRITASGSAPEIAVGGFGGGSHNGGNHSHLYLGQVNTIDANTISVGRVKQGGSDNGIFFNSALTNANPTVSFRGADGVSPVSQWFIGNGEATGGTTGAGGVCDFTGGSVDALVDTMTIGRASSSTSGGGTATGTLTFDNGTVNVNTLQLGLQPSNSSKSGNGTVNVNGAATLTVNSNLTVAQVAGGSGAASTMATVNITGGAMNVSGTVAFGGGAVNINVTNGLLNLPPHSSLLASTVTVDGGTITNVDVLQASNSLVLANGGVIATPQTFDMGPAGFAAWDVSGATGGGLTVSNTFSGAGYLTGNLTMAAGSVLNSGGSGAVNPLYLYNNLALDGTTLRMDLSNSGFSGSDQINVYGSLTLGATNDVRISPLNGSLDTVNPYNLISYGSLTGDASDFQVSGPVAQSRYTFSFGTIAPYVQLTVGGTGPANLLWAGNGTANSWDLTNTTDWSNGGNPDKFYNLDNVTFDDTGSATPPVNLVGTLYPGSVTMNNSTKSYTFAGAGSLNGSVTNLGSGGLSISNDNTNHLDALDIENGNVTLAGDSANNFGAGGLIVNSPTASATIANTNANNFGSTGILVNGGTLTFDQPADATMASPILGYGTVTKQNTNTLTMSGDNSGFSSAINVTAGTLKAGATSIVGSGGLTIANTGALDVNGLNFSGVSTITASGTGPNGNGAIVNGGADQVNAFKVLTLAGDTTFGGSGRWDVRGSSGSPATLSVGSGGYNITKVGTNQVALVYCSVDPTLGNVDVQQGEFSVQTTTAQNGGVGDPTKTVTVHAGAMLETYGLGAAYPLNKLVTLQDAATVQNDHDVSVLGGVITLQGNALVNANATLIFSNTVTGPGGLIQGGGSTLVLAAANDYSGATLITNGTIQVDGSVAGSGVDVAGGTLSGLGAITAPVTIETNGVVAPGDGAGSIGALSVANTLMLEGVNQMDVDKTNGVITNDLLTNVTTLTLGGTLQLNLTGDALANGDQIALYSAGSIKGAFSSIVPATPGAGLAWDSSALDSQGVLKVSVAPPTGPTIGTISVSGGQAIITGTGGTAGSSYAVLTSTNVALPISAWTPVLTNQFGNNGSFSFTNAIGGAAQRFYLLQLR